MNNSKFHLNPSQTEMLSAIFDTILAELTPEETQHILLQFQGKEHIYDVRPDQVVKACSFSATKLNMINIITEFIQNNASPEVQADFTRVLDTLNSHTGSLLLTGYWEPLTKHDRKTREKVLAGWRNSRFQTLRSLFKTLSSLCLFNAYSRTESPLVDCLHIQAKGDAYFENHPEYDPVHHERISMLNKDQAIRNTYDVVVVGSGAGGGVAAAELASAGYSVLVIEKGKYYHQDDMVLEEEKCYENMYDGGASQQAKSGAIQCLSGSTLGGGTALNYLVSLKPQHFVREEWAELGLPYFTSKEFNKDLDKVFERIGASKVNLSKTKTNEKFELGCEELGYHIEEVYVNTGGKPHHCGKCMMGCKHGIKNSTANTWLKDAFHNGAHFLEQTFVTRVLMKGGKTIGVECQAQDSDMLFQIRAQRVVIAAGALRTPSILKASGLKNPHIGRHLRLQPILIGLGVYDEPIRQTEGPLITRVSNVSDDCHGDKYGAKIEEGLLLPGALASRLPWLGAAKHRELMLKHRSIASFVNVVRDKDSVGVVIYDPKNKGKAPVFDYALSQHDEKSMTISIERNMKIMAASGARELITGQPNVEPFKFRDDEVSSVDNPRFVQWLRRVRKAGISAVATSLVSVHQLGSCRMGVSPKSSAVQPTGETWEVKNLFVADGSVFPTAVGVNPMVTIEAISLHVSRQVKLSLNHSRL